MAHSIPHVGPTAWLLIRKGNFRMRRGTSNSEGIRPTEGREDIQDDVHVQVQH